MKFDLEDVETFENVKNKINECEKKGHIQQSCYSTHLDVFTQVCFSCKKITTNNSKFCISFDINPTKMENREYIKDLQKEANKISKYENNLNP